MLFAAIFFAANWVIGKGIQELFGLELKLISHIFAIVLGTTLNTLSIFIVSMFFGLNIGTVISTTLALLIISIFVLYKKGFNLEFNDFKIKNNLLQIGFFVFTLIFLIIFFSKSIYQNDQQIIAGNRLVWTDWPIHIAIMSSFSKGDNFPPQNPQYANQLISYPFFSDFLSAILNTTGSNIKTAFIFPGILLSFSSICLLYYLGKFITGSSKKAILGVIIGVLWGGLGFIYLALDAINSSSIVSTLLNPPLEYTFLQEKNLWFFTFLYSEILPQRAFLFGLPLAIISLILILLGIKFTKKNYLLLAGYTIGIMPFFHMHSFLSVCLILAVLLPLLLIDFETKNKLQKFRTNLAHISLYLLLPIAGLLLIQYPILKLVDLNQTIGFNFGFMKQNENFLIFWFKNTGLFWPLLILAFYLVRKNQVIFNLLIAISFIFIIANIFRFAPWPYDNLKVFTYWYLIGAFYVAIVITKIYSKNFLFKVLAVILTFTLVASGTFELVKTLNSKNKLIMWQNKDFEISKVIEETTEPNSLILTAAFHNHPAITLAGRRAIIGFPGNAWSWGYKDWAQREVDVKKMFQAQNETETANLLKKYRVNYVLVSDIERSFEPNLNEFFFERNLEFAGVGENFKIYKVL